MKKVISKDGTAIAFDQLGHGPALIFVPGAIAGRKDAVSQQESPSLPFTLFAQLLVSETLFLGLFVATLLLLACWAQTAWQYSV